jgi:hypothetical protein
MSTTPEKSLRDRYFANDIFRIGDIVEDTTNGSTLKIIDRGSNYVTVTSQDGVVTKKWLNEVVEPTKVIPEIILEEVKPKDFTILESGQIKLFGYETKNFDQNVSELMLEQFDEFDDLYSKHQIIKCLDLAIQETSADKAYSLIEKVSGFYTKHKISEPLIVEQIRSDIERRRIVEILATIADVKPTMSYYKTISESIQALRSKYKQRSQWEIIYPFFKLAESYGLTGIIQKLPFDFSTLKEEEQQDNVVLMTLEENFDMLCDELCMEDIDEAFSGEESSEELLTEVLSIETRNKLSRKLSQRSGVIAVKRERAMSKAATTEVLMNRARKLAETLLKRVMFHKAAGDLNRQEKERFEAGAQRRKALVARLAMKLLPQVRQLQSLRLHHDHKPVSHSHDAVTANNASTANQNGAS